MSGQWNENTVGLDLRVQNDMTEKQYAEILSLEVEFAMGNLIILFGSESIALFKYEGDMR